MPLQITNSLTRKKEVFTPLEAGKVRMYVCGPTVYGLTHVGNARPVIFFDVVRRYLEMKGYQVTYISNYTDVDDKIINKARETSSTATAVAQKYIQEFLTDVHSLDVRDPDHRPRVTETIPEIIEFIAGLVKKGVAYVTKDGEVLYAVRKFKAYGQLSGKNIDEMLVGVRVQPGENKKDPLDFSLWKPQKADDEPAWDSPWGKGRPGWHIECSAMAMRYFGETFDIHGGGIDLMHPHHENELAQTEGLTGKPFVKYWMHNNLVTIHAEKMSKSLGNIFLNREFITKYHPETLKYLLLSGQYRSPIDFSERHIRDSQAALHRFYSTVKKAEALPTLTHPATSPAPTPEEANLITMGDSFQARFVEAMDDDFNTAKVVGQVFEWVRALNGYFDRKGFKPTPHSGWIATQFLQRRKEMASILNMFGMPSEKFLGEIRDLILKEKGLSVTKIEGTIQARHEARARKDFATADKLRQDLLTEGIELKDTPKGTEWDVVFTASSGSEAPPPRA